MTIQSERGHVTIALCSFDKVKKDTTGEEMKKIGKEVKKIAVHVVGGNGD